MEVEQAVKPQQMEKVDSNGCKQPSTGRLDSHESKIEPQVEHVLGFKLPNEVEREGKRYDLAVQDSMSVQVSGVDPLYNRFKQLLDFIPITNKDSGDTKTPSLDMQGLLFLVKFTKKAYMYSEWMTNAQVESLSGGKEALRSFLEREQRRWNKIKFQVKEGQLRGWNAPRRLSFFPRSFCKPELILSHKTMGSKLSFLIKWRHLPYDQATWEPSSLLFGGKLGDISEPLKGYLTHLAQFHRILAQSDNSSRRRTSRSSRSNKSSSPVYLRAAESAWRTGKSGSLFISSSPAFSPALIASVLNRISKCPQNTTHRRPFLVVVPSPAVEFWVDEIRRRWENKQRVVGYSGSKASMEAAKNVGWKFSKKKEAWTHHLNTSYATLKFGLSIDDGERLPFLDKKLAPKRSIVNLKFDVLVTSPDNVLRDIRSLHSLRWKGVVLYDDIGLRSINKMGTQLFESLSVLVPSPNRRILVLREKHLDHVQASHMEREVVLRFLNAFEIMPVFLGNAIRVAPFHEERYVIPMLKEEKETMLKAIEGEKPLLHESSQPDEEYLRIIAQKLINAWASPPFLLDNSAATTTTTTAAATSAQQGGGGGGGEPANTVAVVNESGKIRFLNTLLKKALGQKSNQRNRQSRAVILAHSPQVLDTVQRALEYLSWEPIRYGGEAQSETHSREAAIERFNEWCDTTTTTTTSSSSSRTSSSSKGEWPLCFLLTAKEANSGNIALKMDPEFDVGILVDSDLANPHRDLESILNLIIFPSQQQALASFSPTTTTTTTTSSSSTTTTAVSTSFSSHHQTSAEMTKKQPSKKPPQLPFKVHRMINFLSFEHHFLLMSSLAQSGSIFTLSGFNFTRLHFLNAISRGVQSLYQIPQLVRIVDNYEAMLKFAKGGHVQPESQDCKGLNTSELGDEFWQKLQGIMEVKYQEEEEEGEGDEKEKKEAMMEKMMKSSEQQQQQQQQQQGRITTTTTAGTTTSTAQVDEDKNKVAMMDTATACSLDVTASAEATTATTTSSQAKRKRDAIESESRNNNAVYGNGEKDDDAQSSKKRKKGDMVPPQHHTQHPTQHQEEEDDDATSSDESHSAMNGGSSSKEEVKIGNLVTDIVHEWGADAVSFFINMLGIPQTAISLRQNGITGSELLSFTDEEKLKEYDIKHQAERMVLVSAVNHLRKPCNTWTVDLLAPTLKNVDYLLNSDSCNVDGAEAEIDDGDSTDCSEPK